MSDPCSPRIGLAAGHLDPERVDSSASSWRENRDAFPPLVAGWRLTVARRTAARPQLLADKTVCPEALATALPATLQGAFPALLCVDYSRPAT
jgi:hypothetical protein